MSDTTKQNANNEDIILDIEQDDSSQTEQILPLDDVSVQKSKSWEGQIKSAFEKIRNSDGTVNQDEFSKLPEAKQKAVQEKYPELFRLAPNKNELLEEAKKIIKEDLEAQQKILQKSKDDELYNSLKAQLPEDLTQEEISLLNSETKELFEKGYSKSEALNKAIRIVQINLKEKKQDEFISNAALLPDGDVISKKIKKLKLTPRQIELARQFGNDPAKVYS
jgi:hydroxymethylpyrimidine pyrophosphatase-like HAD family hydrolase